MTEEEGHQQELEEREQIEATWQVAPRNVYQRMAAAMAEVTYVQKEKPSGKGLQYAIVTHDAVTKKVRPALLKHGVIYWPCELSHKQEGNRTELTGKVRFQNVDDKDDYFDVPSIGYGVDNQDKGPGKATSYLVKMALLKAMGLETGMDPDLDQTTEFKQTAPDGTDVPTLEEAIKACGPSIRTIKDGIFNEDLGMASEAWQELTGGEKMALWVAPSKGGPFTTEERAVIKSAEFRQAHFGEQHG
jgi:hypothetical protein